MVRERKLLQWCWVLLVLKVAGIPRFCYLVVIVVAGWLIISLYDSDSEECRSSLARMRNISLNRWSLLLCSGISPSLVLASFTPSLPLIPVINHTALGVVLSLIYLSCYLGSKSLLHTQDEEGRESCRQLLVRSHELSVNMSREYLTEWWPRDTLLLLQSLVHAHEVSNGEVCFYCWEARFCFS